MKKIVNTLFTDAENNLKINAFLLLFSLMIFLEFTDKIFFFYDVHFPVSSGVKFLIFVFLFLFLFVKEQYKFLLISLILIACFSLGQAFTIQGFSFNNIFILLKFIFPLLILEASRFLLKSESSIQSFFRFFEKSMILNSILILIGVVFSIRIFNTYEGGRFGYNGIFRAASTGSYAYIITLMYFLLTYKSAVIKNWKFILIFISCFFIGTKAVYLAMGFSLAYVVITSKIPGKKIILSVGGILSLAAVYFFFFHYGIFNTIRQSDGLISALLSYRDELFFERTLPYIQENWNWMNYLFGGVSNFDLRSQMDIIDVLFFWGILGGAFYLYVFFKFFLPFKINRIGWMFISFLVFIIVLAGNFFLYSFAALFLVVLKLKLEEKCSLNLTRK